jgi:hypothetical protein
MSARHLYSDTYSPENIVAFMQSRGHCVVRTSSCWWYNEYRQSRVLMSFPLQRLIQPSKEELCDLFRRAGRVRLVRFLGPMAGKGRESCLWICRLPYDLQGLAKKSRNQVRRGLEQCVVRRLSFSELLAAGEQAHADTARRHGQAGAESGVSKKLEECAAYEAFGAFVGDELAAYLVTLQVEDWVHVLVNRSTSAFLKFYPNNSLVFTVVRELLSRSSVSTVSYGWESLADLPGLNHFKEDIGFRRLPVKQRAFLTPSLRPLLSLPVCRVASKLARWLGTGGSWQRVANLLQIVSES